MRSKPTRGIGHNVRPDSQGVQKAYWKRNQSGRDALVYVKTAGLHDDGNTRSFAEHEPSRVTGNSGPGKSRNLFEWDRARAIHSLGVTSQSGPERQGYAWRCIHAGGQKLRSPAHVVFAVIE